MKKREKFLSPLETALFTSLSWNPTDIRVIWTLRKVLEFWLKWDHEVKIFYKLKSDVKLMPIIIKLLLVSQGRY